MVAAVIVESETMLGVDRVRPYGCLTPAVADQVIQNRLVKLGPGECPTHFGFLRGIGPNTDLGKSQAGGLAAKAGRPADQIRGPGLMSQK